MFCLMLRACSYGENSPARDTSYALAQLSPVRSCFAPLFPEMGMAGSIPLGGSRTGTDRQCSLMWHRSHSDQFFPSEVKAYDALWE